MYVNDPDVPQIFSADACKAAGTDPATLKNWISRTPSAILMSDDDRAAFAGQTELTDTGSSKERVSAGSGRSHLFTYRRVMQIALVQELVDMGFPPRRAGMIAAGFTDVGDGGGGFVGDTVEIGRMPGELYKSGLTFLIAAKGREIGHVLQVTMKTPMVEALFHGGHDRTSAAIVDVTKVHAKVTAGLGVERHWFQPNPRTPNLKMRL